MKELDIFQVLSKNYDYFDAEKGYHYIEMETITWEWTPVELEEYDPDFYPIETDITMTFVQKYLNPEKWVMLIIKDDIIATYYPNESILEINNSRFNLGWDVQYWVYSRISLENSEKFMELGDIFCESDEHGKYSEKTGKDIQNAFWYLNSKIEAKTGIKDFFWIRKKAIHKDYPILLK